MYCCGICGLGGISGGGETTELRDEPKLSVPGLLPRAVLLAFALSVLGQSVLAWSSGIGGGDGVFDVADLHPFRIDFRTTGFSFSGGGTLTGGMGGGGVVARGRSEDCGMGDGKVGGEGIRRIGYGDSWSNNNLSIDALPREGCICAATIGGAWPGLPL
jgi:hypothetical protein